MTKHGSNHRHQTRIARRVATAAGINYVAAHRRVLEAARAGLLPRNLEHLDAAVAAVLAGPSPTSETTLTTAGVTAGLTLPTRASASPTITLGAGRDGIPLELAVRELNMHAFVFGSPGSGKSELLKTLTGQLLDLGWSGLVLDMKADLRPGGMRDWCAQYTQQHTTAYQKIQVGDQSASAWIDPLAGLDPDQMREVILSLNRTDAAYWTALSTQQLGRLIDLFTQANTVNPEDFAAPTMLDIGRVLSFPTGPQNAPAVKKMVATLIQRNLMTTAQAEETYSSVLRPNKDQLASAIGLGSKLTMLYDTRAGRHVLLPGAGRTEYDVTRPVLSYAGLDAYDEPELTRIVSSALLQRLSVYSSARATGQMGKDPTRRFVIIDEANWVDKHLLQNLLSRARAAGVVVILASQSPTDWNDPQYGDLFTTLLQNTNVLIAMSQTDPRGARVLADVLGTRPVLQLSTVAEQFAAANRLDRAAWLSAQYDMGEFTRSLLDEFITDLYRVNRLEPYTLLPAVAEHGTGVVVRPAVELPAVDRAELSPGAIRESSDGTQYANAFTCPELARHITPAHLLTLVVSHLEQLNDPQVARQYGSAIRDRMRSLMRCLQQFVRDENSGTLPAVRAGQAAVLPRAVPEERIVSPEQLRLPVGEAIIRVGWPTTRVEWAAITMRDPRT